MIGTSDEALYPIMLTQQLLLLRIVMGTALSLAVTTHPVVSCLDHGSSPFEVGGILSTFMALLYTFVSNVLFECSKQYCTYKVLIIELFICVSIICDFINYFDQKRDIIFNLIAIVELMVNSYLKQ